jgi:predicted O-methyltransferase YrrM
MTYASLEAVLFRTEGMISVEEAHLLYDLARDAKDGCIVEIGAYRGRSTVALALGSKAGCTLPVYAIDPHEEFVGALGGVFGPQDRAKFFEAMLDSGCFDVVRLVNLRSQVVSSLWDKSVSLLWIDGDHSYEGVKGDFERWLPHLAENAVVAFHDSIKPDQGPTLFVAELLQAGEFEMLAGVGEVTVTARRASR